ncbi:MAG: hypothetical protein RL434_1322 [Pseudomonadota bacterium]
MSPRVLSRADLMPLERYHAERPAFRARVIAHKISRQVALGPHITLLFEDALTIQYQVQEMLRVERIFEAEAIDEELAAYNPLIPDGDNWKATMLIEYEDVEERRVALEKLVDVEHRIWARVGQNPPVFAVADEDLDRSRDNKTAAVHFLRFPLDAASIRDLKAGASLGFGVDHPAYGHGIEAVADATRASLVADLA